MEQEQISNSTTAVHDTLLPQTSSNETTAFRYSANVDDESVPCRKGLKILFLSADTGGGHRASAESLANQVRLFLLL